MAAILGSLIGAYGMQGMFVATFLAGIMLIIAAVLHLGNLTAFVPAPVITGFTSGIAVIIALGQIDNFFGILRAVRRSPSSQATAVWDFIRT